MVFLMIVCFVFYYSSPRVGSIGQRPVQLARSKDTRGDIRRLHAVDSAGLLAGEVGLERRFRFRAAQEEFVGTFVGVKFGTDEMGVDTTKIAFCSETQYMIDRLN